ncbi:MAG: mechanosensitive ion channel [Acidimicrobiia bacterium]|nr:mechanosensitive ion channel [Acidimicrobiia bacterium]
MDDVRIVAIGAQAIGLMAGLAGAGLLHRALTKGRGDDPVYRNSARAMAISCFVFFTVAGSLVAISVLNHDSFDDVPSRLVDVLPRYLIAGLVVVAGRAIALAAGSVVSQALEASSPRVRAQAAALVRFLVTAAAVVIALAQLGVNITLLQITGAALLFGLAGAAALLVGLGGREVASEVAAGRYLVRVLQVGDHVEIPLPSGSVTGRVVSMQPGTIEVDEGGGTLRHIPNSQVLAAGPRVLPD